MKCILHVHTYVYLFVNNVYTQVCVISYSCVVDCVCVLCIGVCICVYW